MDFLTPVAKESRKSGRFSTPTNLNSNWCEDVSKANQKSLKDRRRSRLLPLSANSPLKPSTPQSSRETVYNDPSENEIDHFNDCITLSTQNKINSTNAFNLQLIDYMANAVKKKNFNDFQFASAALDASSKIYAGRVDATSSATYRLLRTMNVSTATNAKTSEHADDAVNGDNQEDPTQPSQRIKKRKKAETIEKNLKKITLQNQIDSEFVHNAFFSRIGNSFDLGEANHLFLNQLKSQGDYQELCFDSDCMLVPVYEPYTGSTTGLDGGGGGGGGNGGGGVEDNFTSRVSENDLSLPSDSNLTTTGDIRPSSDGDTSRHTPSTPSTSGTTISPSGTTLSPTGTTLSSVSAPPREADLRFRFKHLVPNDQLDSAQLCPSLRMFKFNNWNPNMADNTQFQVTNSQNNVESKLLVQEDNNNTMEYSPLDPEEYAIARDDVDDYRNYDDYDEEQEVGGGTAEAEDGDDGGFFGNDGEGLSAASQAEGGQEGQTQQQQNNVPQAGLQFSSMEEVRRCMTSSPTIHSYFDPKLLAAFRESSDGIRLRLPMNKNNAVVNNSKRSKKIKKPFSLNFDLEIVKDMEENLAIPEKINLKKKTLQLKMKKIHCLPNKSHIYDCKYFFSTSQFPEFFIRDVNDRGVGDDVRFCKPGQPLDAEDTCDHEQASMIDGINDMDENITHEMIDHNFNTMNTRRLSMPGEQGFKEHGFNDRDQQSGEPLQMIDMPHKVQKLDISYSKVSKKVDIKKIKSTMWKYVSDEFLRSSHAVPASAPASQTSLVAPSSPDLFLDSSTREVDVEQVVSEISLNTIYSRVVSLMDSKANKVGQQSKTSANANNALSIHIAFICLLHLANENNLEIKGNKELDKVIVKKCQESQVFSE